MKFAITGASGYIGSRLLRLAQAEGHEVLALSRRPCACADAWWPFTLEAAAQIVLPTDVQVVFHLAAQTQHGQVEEQAELRAAEHLLAESVHAGARFVFVSSQTAREDAPTAYGRLKWQIEQRVLAAGGIVLRPGLVYGAAAGGLFATLVSCVRRFPLIPSFVPTPLVQPVHVDDLAIALLRSVDVSRGTSQAVLCIGAPEPYPFTAFLSALAEQYLRSWRCRIPVPVVLVRWIGSLLGRTGAAKLGLDRLESLFSLPRMNTAQDLQCLALTLRPLDWGMARSGDGRRRALLKEGGRLLSYLLKERPSAGLLRRYVRCIESARDGLPLQFAGIGQLPAVLGALDHAAVLSSSVAGAELAWRLDAAVMIAESSPQGRYRFLPAPEGSGRLLAGLHLVRAGLVGGMAMMMGFLGRHCWRLMLRGAK